MLWIEPQRVEIAKHSYDLSPGYIEWKSIKAKDTMFSAKDDSIQPANPLPERMLTKMEILRQELKVEKRRNVDLDHLYHTELGQCQYFLKIQENKVKNERKEQELLLKDFKKLGIKNKRLKDDLKSKKENPSKRIKLREST